MFKPNFYRKYIKSNCKLILKATDGLERYIYNNGFVKKKIVDPYKE